jgi:ketosteroid isomerase-like protein
MTRVVCGCGRDAAPPGVAKPDLEFAMSGVTGGAASGDAAQQAAHVELLQAEESVRRTFVANELEAYYAHFASDLRVWTPEGAIDLPAYMRAWTAYIDAGAQVLELEYIDMHIAVSPAADAAVANFLVRVRIREADGTVRESKYQESDVWFRRGSRWKIVHAHYSATPMVKQ